MAKKLANKKSGKEKEAKKSGRGGSKPGVKKGHWAENPNEGRILLIFLITCHPEVVKSKKNKTTR